MKHAFDFLTVPVANEADVPCTVKTYNSREEWLEARRALGIGSSDASAALGLSKFNTPLGLFHEKLGLKRDDGNDERRKELLTWGQLLEGPIAMMYVERTKREVFAPPPYSIFISKQHPFLFASPDRIVIDPARPERGPGAMEIKNVGEWMADEWEDGVPDEYVVQHQEQLAVLGLSWGSVAVLMGGQRFAYVDIDRDQGLIDIIVPKLGAFWQDVQDGNAPPAGSGDKELLKRLYPGTTGEVIQLDASFMELDEQREHAAAAIKELEKMKAEAENKIRAALGEAIGGIMPNGVTYTNKPQDRVEYTVQATTFKVLRRSGTKLKKQSDKAAKMPAPVSEENF